MGKVGWIIAIIIVVMVAGLVAFGESEQSGMTDSTGCHYEYKMKNGKRIKELDCD